MTTANPSILHLAVIIILILKIKVRFSDESEFLVNRSNTGLNHVPKDLPLETTILDLSQNSISELQTSDIQQLSKLKVLIISHNRIQHFNISVFKFNQELEHLDLSHNKLEKISCHSIENLKHLDLSFNAFDALPICNDFGRMTRLEFLGLSATKLQKSVIQTIAHLNIKKVLLVLGESYGEKENSESLQYINTESLHIIFPTKKDFNFNLDVSASAAVSLELSNVKCAAVDNRCSFQTVLLTLQKNPKILNLTLNNIETTWDCFFIILQLVWPSSIEYFSITNVTLQGQLNFRDFNYTNTSLKAVTIHQLVSYVFKFQQNVVYKILSNMNVPKLRVSSTRMLHMLCPSQSSPFLYLDFSNNLLTDMVFKNCRNLIELQTLILRMNQLKELANIIHMTKMMKSLQQLDISQNALRCLPLRVKILDLHRNRIRSIPNTVNSLEALEELNVAFNSLTSLPGCGAFSRLSVLAIDYNAISNPSADFFQNCQKIRSLKAGNNPFQCTCELREFIRSVGQESRAVVEGWPDSYRCDYPESSKGIPLKDFRVSQLSCNPALLMATIVGTVLVWAIAMTILCVYFDVPWYLRMVCQWTQTRRRARNIHLEELQRNLQFHAFISYSVHDSAWVKNELLPNLEKEDIRVCLHERHFVPGKSIVENIINCIEKSYKSIFVLSPHFVQSEWCHYELYFAHHNLFHEGSDNLLLILLEPIPQDHIPNKYHKLRALMTQRTYLEWPKEKNKQGLFWANVRAAFDVKLTLMNENNVGAFF